MEAMDDRMRRAGINAVTTFLNQIAATVCGLVIPWVLIGSFGSEAYGATTSISQFLAYIALFEGGIGRVARGALYGPLASGDEGETSRIYLAIKRFFRTIGFAFLCYSVILAFFYHDIADVTVFTGEYTFALVLSMAIGKFAEYMGGISNITLLNADQRQYVVNTVTILSNVLNVIVIVLLVSLGADILWVRFISSLVFVLKPIIFTLYLKRHYNIIKSKERAVLKNKATGIAQHMAYVIQNNTDVMILTVCADLKHVAVYSVYHLVSFSLRNITTSFTGGMEAIFGNMIANGEQDELNKTYRRYSLILILLTLTLFGTAGALIVPFVKLYTAGAEDANYIQPIFAQLLLLGEAINCLIWPAFNLSIAANKLRESQIGAFLEAAINLVVSFVLVLFFDPLIGVAIGTLLSVLFKSVYYIVFSGKNVLRVRVGRLLAEFCAVISVLVTVSVGGMAIVSNIPLDNYFLWMVAGFVTVAVTGAISLAVARILYPGIIGEYAVLLKNRVFGSKQ